MRRPRQIPGRGVMTKPDEALLWAREHWATVCDEDGFPDLATAYRAGAAASEARIKELEARVAELERRTPMDGLRCEVGEDGKTMKITIPGKTFLAPLKEADQ